MTIPRLLELAAALAIFGVGVWLYRSRPSDRAAADGNYGSQGAVLLFALGAIMAIHALGGLDYHPSQAEADYFRAHAQ